MSEPRCIEAGASISVGGKVQVVKYEIDQNYFYSYNRKYTIPEEWTEEDVKDFQKAMAIEIREELEPLAQAEVDDLLQQRADNA